MARGIDILGGAAKGFAQGLARSRERKQRGRELDIKEQQVEADNAFREMMAEREIARRAEDVEAKRIVGIHQLIETERAALAPLRVDLKVKRTRPEMYAKEIGNIEAKIAGIESKIAGYRSFIDAYYSKGAAGTELGAAPAGAGATPDWVFPVSGVPEGVTLGGAAPPTLAPGVPPAPMAQTPLAGAPPAPTGRRPAVMPSGGAGLAGAAPTRVSGDAVMPPPVEHKPVPPPGVAITAEPPLGATEAEIDAWGMPILQSYDDAIVNAKASQEAERYRQEKATVLDTFLLKKGQAKTQREIKEGKETKTEAQRRWEIQEGRAVTAEEWQRKTRLLQLAEAEDNLEKREPGRGHAQKRDAYLTEAGVESLPASYAEWTLGQVSPKAERSALDAFGRILRLYGVEAAPGAREEALALQQDPRLQQFLGAYGQQLQRPPASWWPSAPVGGQTARIAGPNPYLGIMPAEAWDLMQEFGADAMKVTPEAVRERRAGRVVSPGLFGKTYTLETAAAGVEKLITDLKNELVEPEGRYARFGFDEVTGRQTASEIIYNTLRQMR